MKPWNTVHPDYERIRESVEKVLAELLEQTKQIPEIIHEAMRYSTLQGGKRVRSVLVVGITEDLQGPKGDALLVGASLEIVHAASLILDDLPSMDNADKRRGHPSTHAKYGEACAILTAFALVNYAYEILSQLPSVPPSIRCELMAEIARTIGAEGLIAGQWLDLTLSPEQATLEDIARVHHLKTAVLFESASAMAGLINQVREVDLKHLRKFGRFYGEAFQIMDDLLDWMGDESELGKPVKQDSEKISYQRLNALNEAFERFDQLMMEAYRLATGATWHRTAQLLLEPLLALNQTIRQRLET